MIEILSLLTSAAIGCVWIWTFLPSRPAVFRLSLGCGLGTGAMSAIYYLMLLAGVAQRVPMLTVDAVLLAGGVVFLLRRRDAHMAPGPRTATPTLLYIATATFATCLLLFAIGFSRAAEANPQGQWDAFAIWNVRAKFLSAGEPAWRRAVSPLLVRTHPDYPLLLSAAIARAWNYAGAFSTAGPIAIALMYSLAMLGTLVSGIASARGAMAAWMAGLVCFTAASYWRAVPAQYADIPLSFYILSGLVLLHFDEIVLSGVFCSLAAWTKDEGMVFTAIVTVLLGIRDWRKLPRFLIGAMPVLAVAITFRLFVAPAANAWVQQPLGSVLSKCFDRSRHAAILQALLLAFWRLGPGFANPLLLIAVLIFLLGVNRRAVSWPVPTAVACMLASDYAAYLTTPNDLAFQLGGSVDRLTFQLWPSILLCVFLRLKEIPAPAPVPSLRKPKRAA